MSNLEMIEALCSIAETQSKIIKALSTRLCELGAVYMADEIAEVNKRLNELYNN